jgi:DnaJ-class molecular chaperone
MQDHYQMLGISPIATTDAVKLAYRKKAALYHPDKNPAPEAAARFREVQDAYEVLSDAGRRRAYDDFRQRSLIDDPLAVAQALAANYLKGILA